MSDLITANIEELNDFIDKAHHIKDKMEDSTGTIMNEYRNILDWEDQIRERVGQILDEIQRKEIEIFDYLDEVYRNVKEFSDELDDYLGTSRRY